MKQIIPDVYTVAIMIGDDLEMDTTNSVLMKADDQVSFGYDVIHTMSSL